MIIKCSLKIGLIISEHHNVKLVFFLQSSSTVQLFDFLTSDKQLPSGRSACVGPSHLVKLSLPNISVTVLPIFQSQKKLIVRLQMKSDTLHRKDVLALTNLVFTVLSL